MAPSREAAQLAGALADFFHGGGGPCTHRELDHLFEDAGFSNHPDASEGSKRDRVREALTSTWGKPTFWVLVQMLLGSLGDYDYLADGSVEARRLRRALSSFGRSFDDTGRITGGAAPAVAQGPETVLSRPVLRQQIDRLDSAARREDVEHVLGISKELIESTVTLVLAETGVEPNEGDHLPQRAKKAQQALLLHGAVHDVSGDFGRQVKTILSSMSAIANATVELRNLAGTGHGRAAPIKGMQPRHAKLVAGSAIVYCEMLLDTLDDPTAPWQSTNE